MRCGRCSARAHRVMATEAAPARIALRVVIRPPGDHHADHLLEPSPEQLTWRFIRPPTSSRAIGALVMDEAHVSPPAFGQLEVDGPARAMCGAPCAADAGRL